MWVEDSQLIKKLSFFAIFLTSATKTRHSFIQPSSSITNHKNTSMPTATRSRRLRRTFRAAPRGRPAATPAKEPPIVSLITTPIGTDGDGATGPRGGTPSLTTVVLKPQRESKFKVELSCENGAGPDLGQFTPRPGVEGRGDQELPRAAQNPAIWSFGGRLGSVGIHRFDSLIGQHFLNPI